MPASEYYIGLMSGTSLDAIDAVLLDCSTPPGTLRATLNHPIDTTLRQQLLALCQPGDNEIERAGAVHLALAEQFTDAVAALLAKAGIDAGAVAAIGCHGQTVRHCPEAGFTVQLGSADLLAARTGIAVVTDFRNRDMVLGGQGAPLVPAFHRALWGQRGRLAVVNIGGMANVTLLAAGEVECGFDTGPGNVLLDYWIGQQRQLPFDQDGVWAASGHADPTLLDRLLADPYFQRPPPKSTGREYFNGTWLETRLAALPAADIQATLLELTARSIADALAPLVPEEVLVCGGGARNRTLMTRLQTLIAVPIRPSDDAGMPAEWVEGAAFAWLARARLHRETGNCPSVTGARRAAVLGALYLP